MVKDKQDRQTFSAILTGSVAHQKKLFVKATGSSFAAQQAVDVSRARSGPQKHADGFSEDIEDLGPNRGDGNRDGVPDRMQADVISLPSSTNAGFLTIDAKGSKLANVNGSRAERRRETRLPMGLFEFELHDVPVGGLVTIDVHLPEDGEFDTYYKLNPVTNELVPFHFDGRTGAVVHDGRVTLFLEDGGRGDADGVANGIILDPGGPGTLENPPIYVTSGDDYDDPNDGYTTLREAVELAEDTPGLDEIRFNLPTWNHESTLTQSVPLTINADLNIVGPVTGTPVTIGVGNPAETRVFEVSAEVAVAIANVTIRDGNPGQGHGGLSIMRVS